MTNEAVRDYLSTQLPLELNTQQHFRLLRTVFALVFASAVVIHLLIQQEDSLLSMLIHTAAIGLVFTVGVGLATGLLYALRNTMQHVRVWHIWAASLAGFILGYYFLPLDFFITWLPAIATNDHVGSFGLLRLLPIWCLVTYLIVQPYMGESLKLELARLRDINELLQGRTLSDRPTDPLIRFESGKTDFALPANTIRNVVVEDHYCYVHYRHNEGFAKRDLARPIRDVLALLPADFVQVHRSHIINVQHISSLVRENRRIHVLLDSGFKAPVSRHRLQEVLPLLQRQIALTPPLGDT